MSSNEGPYQAPTIDEMGEIYHGANICIVSQGPTAKRDFSQYSDEENTPGEPWYIWTQNGGWVTHSYTSLAFIMDDLRCDVWDNIKRFDRGEIEEVVRNAKFPLITSIAYPEFPALVEFPLDRAIKRFNPVNGNLNLNETISYMIAMAMMWKVKRIDFWGADYCTEEGKPIRPDKRACCEHWIGRAGESGIQIRITADSDLMRYRLDNSITEIEGVYGYQQNNLPPEVINQLDIDERGRAQIRIGT